MNLMEEIITKKITLEEAYCKGNNYISSIILSEQDCNDGNIAALLHTVAFVESALAKRYMEQNGYILDNQAGIEIWKKKQKSDEFNQNGKCGKSEEQFQKKKLERRIRTLTNHLKKFEVDEETFREFQQAIKDAEEQLKLLR